MRASQVPLAALLLACLASGLVPSPAAAQPRFPRIGLYGSVSGGGFPYVKPDFTLDTLAIASTARFHEVALDVFPISPYRPDIVQALRARNPSIQLLAYVLAEDIWNVHDQDSLRHIPTIIRRTVRDLNGFLYDKVTGAEYNSVNINLAKRDAGGRFVVAEAIANIFRDHIIATGHWNGIFTDIFCQEVGWTQGGTTRVVDYQRAGYPTLAALDAAWRTAADTLAARLRRDGGTSFVLVGNCGPSAQHQRFNGWMRENFPFQQGGTWQSNMLGDGTSRGYLADDRDYVQPPHNWILSGLSGTPGSEYSAANTMRLRYGLASAALGEGVHTFLYTRSARDAPYHFWWYDEYAVDVATGRSSESQLQTGWLGRALGPARPQLWVSSAPDAVTNPGFESNVTSGWSFVHFAPAVASITRDATTAAVGSSSAKITVSVPSTVEWHAYLSSVGQINTLQWNSYSATFWCKANPPRRIHVVAGNSGGQQFIDVDGTWRQYQAVLRPTTSMMSSLTFFLGTQAGDVWLDDVHYQPGVSSVWRRDFQNGIVLVNPTELGLTVPLESAYRRILGTRDPVTNPGGTASSVTIRPYDALFLLRGQIDSTRPAAVQDLRVGP